MFITIIQKVNSILKIVSLTSQEDIVRITAVISVGIAILKDVSM